MIAKYQKKPVIVEAVCFNGDNHQEIMEWIRVSRENGINMNAARAESRPCGVSIETLDGKMLASPSDYIYIIKGVKGEFYPCKPEIFEKTYTKLEG